MAHNSRTLAGALVSTFVALSSFVACNPVAPGPGDGPTPTPTDSALNGVDTCGLPWQPTGGMTVARSYAAAVRLADGTVLVAGGLDVNSVAAASAERFNPATGTWSPAGNMNFGRYYHRAIGLKDGRALVLGGFTDAGSTPTVEIYNPANNSWSLAAQMSTDRFYPQVALLSDGRVLVAGGGGLGGWDGAEIYDPQRNTWSPVGSMRAGRYSAGTALLPDGRVLVAGGIDTNSAYLSSAEIFDPASGQWSAAPPMSTAHVNVDAVALADGRVLVAGGSDAPSAEVFDPASSSWSSTGNMVQGSLFYSNTLRLPDGRVLVAGGQGSFGTRAEAEILDPSTGQWSPIATMSIDRAAATAAVLLDGRILVAGGVGIAGETTSAETYEPCSINFACAAVWAAAPSMAQARAYATSVRLGDGTVLAAGGLGPSGSVGLAERFSSTGGWTAAGTMRTPRFGHRAVALNGGGVLVAGGFTDLGATAAAEVFTSPSTWTAKTSMSTPRVFPQLTLLSGGKVLASGGQDASGSLLASAEVYDPTLNTWTTTTRPMTSPRYLAAAVLLPNNKVLVAGGISDPVLGTRTATAEVYDPATNTWSPVASMSVARYAFSLTLLKDGRVLAAGGTDLPPGAEIFDPGTGTWSPTTNMIQLSRYSFETVALSDGRVLLAGGISSNTAEMYDPYISRWLSLTGMSTSRYGAISAQLTDGRILVGGGNGSAGTSNTVETYTACPPNLPPIAICKNVTVPTSPTTCSAASASVNNGSYDPDNGPGPLTISQSPAGPYNLGNSTVTLTASDSILQSTCSAVVTVVDQTPPTITCPSQQFLECVNGGAVGTFTATFTDNCGGGTVSCAPSGTFLPLGNNTVNCTATDRSGNRSSCSFTATVQDTRPPVTGVSKGMTLWPADGLLHEVTLMDCADFTVDACSGRLNPLKDFGVITYITSDEPDDAPGNTDGNTTGDMQIKKPWLALIRAERDTRGNGRVYTLHYAAKDPSGNSATGSCKVTVPLNGGSTAVDSGISSCIDNPAVPGNSCP